ncbi:MAG: DUF4232 domain-containing protein [Nostocaceae cyanobacterium]|nr:DUF4232 domain-containing protein [Nostocaceae cyanobacterium]
MTLTSVSITGAQADVPRRPRCDTNQLSLRLVEENPGAGNVYNEFAFTNISNKTCTLYGYPGAELLDARNTPIGVKIERDTSKPRKTVTLVPGGKAYFVLRHGRKVNYTDYQNKCAPDSAKLEVTPPNTYNHLIIRDRETPCRRATISPVSATSYF